MLKNILGGGAHPTFVIKLTLWSGTDHKAAHVTLPGRAIGVDTRIHTHDTSE